MKDQPRNVEFQSFLFLRFIITRHLCLPVRYTALFLKYDKYGDISRHQKLLLLWIIYRPDWLCSGKK